jgi:hypothetical protein
VIVRPLALFLPKRTQTRRAVPAHRRSARRAILWGVAVAVLAHAGLAVALETVLPQLRDPEYGYRLVRVREQQRLHPDRPLVLVMGTSRTAYGFDPGAADLPDRPGSPLLFNFGLLGGGPVHIRSRLSALREDGVKPDAVAIELFLAALTIDAPADTLFLPLAAKMTAADLRRLEPELENPAAMRRAWRAARLDPWQAQRLVIVSRIEPDFLPWHQRLDHYWTDVDHFGFDPYPVTRVDDQRPRRLAAVREVFARAAARPQVSASADHAVRALLTDCRTSGVRVALFTTPESPTFRSWYTPESRAALTAYTRALTAEFGYPVFEAPQDYAEEDFADGHHMLPATAARFTRHLTEHHLKPWLATERRK